MYINISIYIYLYIWWWVVTFSRHIQNMFEPPAKVALDAAISAVVVIAWIHHLKVNLWPMPCLDLSSTNQSVEASQTRECILHNRKIKDELYTPPFFGGSSTAICRSNGRTNGAWKMVPVQAWLAWGVCIWILNFVSQGFCCMAHCMYICVDAMFQLSTTISLYTCMRLSCIYIYTHTWPFCRHWGHILPCCNSDCPWRGGGYRWECSLFFGGISWIEQSQWIPFRAWWPKYHCQ